jgi:hypothetical protein
MQRPVIAPKQAQHIPTHILGREIQQTAQARFEILDNETSKLIDLFGSMVEASRVC